jgi:hypothetical protein
VPIGHGDDLERGGDAAIGAENHQRRSRRAHQRRRRNGQRRRSTAYWRPHRHARASDRAAWHRHGDDICIDHRRSRPLQQTADRVGEWCDRGCTTLFLRFGSTNACRSTSVAPPVTPKTGNGLQDAADLDQVPDRVIDEVKSGPDTESNCAGANGASGQQRFARTCASMAGHRHDDSGRAGGPSPPLPVVGAEVEDMRELPLHRVEPVVEIVRHPPQQEIVLRRPRRRPRPVAGKLGKIEYAGG